MKNRKKIVSILAGVMAAIMLLTLLLSLIPVPVSAASSREIKKQIEQLKKDKKELEGQIEDVKKQVKQNEDEVENMVDQKYAIDQEIVLLYEQIDNINQQISAYTLLIADQQETWYIEMTFLFVVYSLNCFVKFGSRYFNCKFSHVFF